MGFQIILPSGDRVASWREVKALHMMIDGRELHVDLIELAMDDFDLILGMDMLAKYGATIDCKRLTVTFAPEGKIPFVFVGSIMVSKVPRISILNAKELLQ